MNVFDRSDSTRAATVERRTAEPPFPTEVGTVPSSARLAALSDLLPKRRRGKMAHLLADQLRERILSGALPEGALLPPERELLELTGLSRATLREALRLLEAEGYIEIARGPHGGCIVRHPSVDQFARSFHFLLRLNQATMRQVLELRWALEPLCAALAARRARPEDLAVMQDSIDQMRQEVGDSTTFYQRNVDFHLAIVRATQNDMLLLLTRLLRHLLYARLKRRPTVAERKAAIAAHEAIYAALVSGDADRAVAETYRHLRAIEHEITDGAAGQEILDPVLAGDQLPSDE